MRVLATALCILLSVPVHAQASPWRVTAGVEEPAPAGDDRAAEYFRRGSKAYELGNYAEAVKLFERSYELSDQADLLFNLGQAYARWYEVEPNIDHLRKSRKLYQNYIIRLDADERLSADARAEAEERIAEVERQIEAHEADENTPEPKPPGPKDKPVYKKGWFWGTIVGVVLVAGGVTAAVLLTRNKGDDFDPELGTLGIGRAPRPLGLRF